MNNPLCLCAALILVSAAPAQLTVTGDVSTLTPIGVYALQGNQTGFDAIAANVTISSAGASVTATVNNSNTFATTMIHFRQWPSGIVNVDLTEQGAVTKGQNQSAASAGTSPSTNAGTFRPGPHSILLRLRGRAGTRGLLEMWASGGLSIPQGAVSGTYRVDVGNDGSVEYTGRVPGFSSQSFVVTIPTAGTLLIKLESIIKATQVTTGSTAYKMGASLRFTPTPLCVGKRYGESCVGPNLTGVGRASGSDWLFELKFSGGTPGAAGLLVLGSRPLSVQIPGFQCPLLTDVLVAVPFRQDNVGGALWNFRISQAIDVDIRIQAADLPGAKTSNGLHVVCLR